MSENNSIVTTVRFPRSVWSRLKHLQADGKIKSIQDAVVRGLDMYFGFLDIQVDRDVDMSLEKAVKVNGFENGEEFNQLVAGVDISTSGKLAVFRKWQYQDGTKEGLLNLDRM